MSIIYKILDQRLGTDFPLPKYATSGSAGIDLIACISEKFVLDADKCFLFSTGISVELRHGQVGLVFPRSGLGHKHGIVLGNSVGVIDSDYRGEIFVSLWNRSSVEYVVNPGDRIAQLLVMSVDMSEWVEAKDLSETERDSSGFGSTGR